MKLLKCPYCSHQFYQGDAPTKQINNFTHYMCPNRSENENEDGKCGKELPIDFFEADSFVISLAGGTDVGKTCYVMALLNQLFTNRQLWNMGISGELIGEPFAVKRFFEMYKKVSLGESIQFMTARLKEESLLVRIVIQQQEKTNHIYISLFDNKGELQEDIGRIIEYIPNIYQSDGMLYLFEPKQFTHLWNVLDNAYVKYGVMTDYYQIIHNIIKMTLHKKPDLQVTPQNMPAALRAALYSPSKVCIGLIMSKIDIISGLLGVKIPNDYNDLYLFSSDFFFDNDIINDISCEIERIIMEFNGGDIRLSRIIKNKRISHKYFGVKSVCVDNKNTPISLDSNGVLLPLIWLLKEFKILK